MALDLRNYFKAAPKRIVTDTFGIGDMGFTVTISACTRPEMDAMRTTAVVKVLDKTTRQYVDTPDLKRIREFLCQKCLVGWDGLTGRKAAYYANLDVTGTPADDEEVEFSVDQAVLLMSSSQAFENFVFAHATDLADAAMQEEAAAKND